MDVQGHPRQMRACCVAYRLRASALNGCCVVVGSPVSGVAKLAGQKNLRAGCLPMAPPHSEADQTAADQSNRSGLGSDHRRRVGRELPVPEAREVPMAGKACVPCVTPPTANSGSSEE